MTYKYAIHNPLLLGVPALLWSIFLLNWSASGLALPYSVIAAGALVVALHALHYILVPVAKPFLIVATSQSVALWLAYVVGAHGNASKKSALEFLRTTNIIAAIIVTAYTLFAAIQITLDPDHALNAAGIVNRQAVSDWVHPASHVLGVSLFRPASLTTHPGKFGQIAFVLFWFLASTMTLKRRMSSRSLTLAGVLIALVGIALSGQRAAFVGCALMLAVACLRERSSSLGILIMSVVVFGALGWLYPDLLRSLLDRAWTVRADGPQRVLHSLAGVWQALQTEPFGIGQGMRSIWSVKYGGIPMYQDSGSLGAEGAWVKAALEAGVIGVVAYALCGGMVAIKLWRSAGAVAATGFAWYWFGWSWVHDTFGNAVVMQMSMGLAGLIVAVGRRKEGAMGGGECGVRSGSRRVAGLDRRWATVGSW